MDKKRDWFESESFWAQYSPVLFDAKRWAEAPAVAEGVFRIIGAKISGPYKESDGDVSAEAPVILDAGCGPGRIAVELALRGARVTGVDLIRPFLNASLDSAQGEGVDLDLEQADLRKFVRPEAFDAAVSLYTSFGYCDTIEEDMQILANIAASLKKGGWFILEMTGREITVRDFTEGEWFEREALRFSPICR